MHYIKEIITAIRSKLAGRRDTQVGGKVSGERSPETTEDRVTPTLRVTYEAFTAAYTIRLLRAPDNSSLNPRISHSSSDSTALCGGHGGASSSLCVVQPPSTTSAPSSRPGTSPQTRTRINQTRDSLNPPSACLSATCLPCPPPDPLPPRPFFLSSSCPPLPSPSQTHLRLLSTHSPSFYSLLHTGFTFLPLHCYPPSPSPPTPPSGLPSATTFPARLRSVHSVPLFHSRIDPVFVCVHVLAASHPLRRRVLLVFAGSVV